jgi:glucosamine-6-phosphate deaminase
VAAAEIQRLQQSGRPVGVIFATGASQLNTLDSLASLPGLPWREVDGFHLDEYVGLDENHPASFRHYLRKNLTGRVAMRNFYEIDGSAKDLEAVRSEYLRKLRLVSPQLCLLGIGENGHLAFNDPAEADFNDLEAMKVVNLDTTCRQQQVAEGWFERLELVPRQALTLAIPTMFRVRGAEAARSQRRTLCRLGRSCGHGEGDRASLPGRSVAAVPGAFRAQRAEPVRRAAASAGAQPDAFGARSADARGRQTALAAAVAELEKKSPKVARLLEEHGEEILGVYALPEAHRKRMRTTNMLERQNQELKWRTRVVRIFPNEQS